MRPVCLAILATILLATAACASPARHVPGELLVLRRPGAALDVRADGSIGARNGRVAALLAQHGLTAATADGDWVRLVSADPAFDPVAAARAWNASGEVAAAAPNILLRTSITIPNDFYVGTFQYWVDDPGDADVQLANAWDVTHGDTSVVIGIMDTGVDLGHPDLAAQIWRNRAEIAGNGIDDDGDGHIDDVNGWDFGDNDADPNPQPIFDEASGIDIAFHGTFVAGLAAAATDNAEGIAGAGWRCRLMPLKVANAAGELTLDASAAAMRYAWRHHASVLNMSLGTTDTLARAFFQALVDSATDRGVVCVAASGNDGTNTPSFPAACNRVLSVGATDAANARAEFSNWGPTVDVAAPGSGMWSSLCRNYEFDEFSQVFYLFLFGWDGQDPYMAGDGTSFASPIAAGVCGLVRARFPALSADGVVQHVIATGDVVAYDEPTGRKLNAFRAVSQAPLAAPPPAERVLAGAWPNPFRGTATLRLALSRAGDADVSVYDAAGRRVRTVFAGALGAGEHRWTWDGHDAAGASVSPGLYFARLRANDAETVVRLVRVH